MFDSNFTFFIGQRYSGRSTLLFTLADIFQSNGLKSIFFGGTDEFYDFSKRKQPFELSFFYRREDKRAIINLNEICIREKINFIFIDDIDFLDDTAIDLLSDFHTKKICTSIFGKKIDVKDLTTYEIIQRYDDDTLKVITKLKIKNTELLMEDFLKSIERDQKLNNILK
jgi:hypothetical protein